ncbi:MAG: zinc ribbon domain-containing protein [Chloroflexota bacterium]|nr:zinc ribbon domain-containing protein [Chloroflexota bacterium]
MPVYEYLCKDCKRRVSVLLLRSNTKPKCPICGGTDLDRRFSSFSVRGTYKDLYEDILGDNQLTSGMLRNDPRAMAEWSKRMGKGMETGHEPNEYDEHVERMEHGEWPSIPGVTAPLTEPPPSEE